MSDYLVKALACRQTFRVMTAVTTETVREAQRRHETWPTATAALGRTMTAAVMTGAAQKGDVKVTVTVQGGGPIGIIVADVDTAGHVRGYVTNSQIDFPANEQGKLDVARAVGTSGFLSVVKDLGLRNNFTGRVPLVSGEIGADFTYYFAESEQIPSAVGVGVLVNPDQSVRDSGGFLIQVLPGADDRAIDEIEHRLKQIPPISRLIDGGRTPEGLLNVLFPDADYQLLERMPVAFTCNCSKEKFGRSIAGIAPKEIRAMITEDHGAEAICRFCGSVYHFSEIELRKMLESRAQN
ncbi:MAG: Hsp33 family molecular chaperone HslO [Sporolactobacillus sp.]|jgi:molecular chaperone Hsp33|nr:Hsp33 family molecular chaperone HslO [Sporolactobacillus sp.]